MATLKKCFRRFCQIIRIGAPLKPRTNYGLMCGCNGFGSARIARLTQASRSLGSRQCIGIASLLVTCTKVAPFVGSIYLHCQDTATFQERRNYSCKQPLTE